MWQTREWAQKGISLDFSAQPSRRLFLGALNKSNRAGGGKARGCSVNLFLQVILSERERIW
jgi:hypothetical protein